MIATAENAHCAVCLHGPATGGDARQGRQIEVLEQRLLPQLLDIHWDSGRMHVFFHLTGASLGDATRLHELAFILKHKKVMRLDLCWFCSSQKVDSSQKMVISEPERFVGFGFLSCLKV